MVTLTATPTAPSVFTGWSGDRSGTSPMTTVTMDAARSCTATFAQVFCRLLRLQDRHLLPMDEWPLEARMSLENYEVVDVTAGDGHQDFVHKPRWSSRHHATELLGKRLDIAAFKDETVRHTGTLRFIHERNHQGKGNLLLFPREDARKTGPVRYRERLGGLLKFYHRAAWVS